MGSPGPNWPRNRSLGVSDGSIARLLTPDMGMVCAPVRKYRVNDV